MAGVKKIPQQAVTYQQREHQQFLPYYPTQNLNILPKMIKEQGAPYIRASPKGSHQ